MTYGEAVRYIEAAGKMGSRLGLERMEEMLCRLGNPEKRLKFIHVAGTNGKGSTAAMLASVMMCAGYRTGLYTSPHLLRYNERFQVDGKEITDEAFAEAAERVRRAADGLEEPLTQFELLTCMAFYCFDQAKCGIVVLEVGLGGRLDATNIIPVPEVAVITRIGLDHTEILGDTISKIAGEKAGIIKQGGTVVLGDQTREVRDVVRSVCCRKEAELTVAHLNEVRFINSTLYGQRFVWRHDAEIELPLLGAHQIQNACTVLETVEQLRTKQWVIPDESVREGLRRVSWPGRFECLSHRPVIIIDGGHNRQCAEAIAHTLQDYFPGKKIIFLIGVLADKDFEGIFDALLPLAKQVIAVTPVSPRAMPAETLCRRLREKYCFAACRPFGRMDEAVAEARNAAGPSDVICACGSLYMIGYARSEFLKTQAATGSTGL